MRPTRSLVWAGEDLVDWVEGGRRLHPDGSATEVSFSFAYASTADQAVGSPTGRYAVIYADRGTKGLVLRDGRLARQINRDYYHAQHYDYPVALGQLPDGREVLVHCPESYTRLEIEELESGRRLTTGDRRQSDIFHSHLQVSPDGRHLLSAGWVWHPTGVLLVLDVLAALADPRALDTPIAPRPTAINTEVATASFDGSGHVLVTTTMDEELFDEDDAEGLRPGELGRWSLEEQCWASRARVSEPPGLLMPMGDYAVGFYEHPKLIEVATGRVVHVWTDLWTGRFLGSYGAQPPTAEDRTPPLALDATGRRFAVADSSGATAIYLD